MENLYENLAELFNRIGFGSRHCPELDALLRSLFTEEEARAALNLSPLAPEPPARVAERLGEDSGKMAALLDDMADKGLIYCSQRQGEKWYKTIQLVPGIFELQFMKGEVTPRAKELARLFDDYFHAPREESQRQGPGISFARVIPIEKTITLEIDVFSYEEARKYIDMAETITLSTCYCRHEQRLLDHGCDYPVDVCLQFGSFARFVRDRGFGREIAHQEAHDVMKRSAEAGLIATSSNTRDRIDFICNCCTCCCAILRSVKNSSMPVRAVASNYLAQVDEEECTGCGDCVERCQMEAVSLEDEVARVDTDRCVGCGVCVVTCPSEALSLTPRSDLQEPPRSFRELIERQAAEKTRAGEF
ncbi:MAG: 4Fe-4S binding protein [Deltaproteobacteria bacterium]|nr:4Fe-4S binding protein [Deltaproteobacteria bacterium]MBW2084583.1 4Fe-4S binding protein [Deltaproteobacteria bacterium]